MPEGLVSKTEQKIEDSSIESLRRILPEVILAGLAKVGELNIDNKEPLTFHDIEHTRNVIERCKKIVAEFKKRDVWISERDEILLLISAAFHDSVQDQFEEGIVEKDTNPDGSENEFVGLEKVIRRRRIVSNEQKSADLAIEFLREKYKYLNKEDEERIRQMVLTTVPGFDKDEKMVFQPNLDKESKPVDRILAMADLGTSGMDSANFVADGDKLFREENLDILRIIEKYNIESYDISEREKEYFKSRMLKWSEAQITFPEKRKKRLERELAFLGEKKEDFIKSAFPGFEDATDRMQKAYNSRKQMDFFTLARDMGYEVKGNEIH